LGTNATRVAPPTCAATWLWLFTCFKARIAHWACCLQMRASRLLAALLLLAGKQRGEAAVQHCDRTQRDPGAVPSERRWRDVRSDLASFHCVFLQRLVNGVLHSLPATNCASVSSRYDAAGFGEACTSAADWRWLRH
jgi:hypothetical protein